MVVVVVVLTFTIDMDELAGGDVDWPGAQALLRGNNPDLDYWSCRSIFSLMGVMGGTGLALLAPSPGFLPFPV